MLREANGLAVASLHSPNFHARRRALPGKSSYSTRPEFLVSPLVRVGIGGGGMRSIPKL